MSRDPEKTVCRTPQSGLALEGGKAEPFFLLLTVNIGLTWRLHTEHF